MSFGKYLVTVHLLSPSAHLSQLIAGLVDLQQEGDVELAICHTQPTWIPKSINVHPRAHGHMMFLEVNNGPRICIDVKDMDCISHEFLPYVDVYWKRSFNPRQCERVGEKVQPLGLNYEMVPEGRLPTQVTCMLEHRQEAPWRTHLRSLARQSGLLFNPTSKALHAEPDFGVSPKALFLARTWNPDEISDVRAREERAQINVARAEIIKRLRHELGPRFLGGFAPTPHAKKCFPDAVVQNTPTDKPSYLKLMKQYPVVVATAGLHGSIGWKFAEYVAFSKAIVTERITQKLPGPIASGRNYLEFADVEGCVESVVDLVTNRALREEMMAANFEYYGAFLKPSKLALRVLEESVELRRELARFESRLAGVA